MKSQIWTFFVINILFFMLSACASNTHSDMPGQNPNPESADLPDGVKPWEKARLKRKEMQWDTDPLGTTVGRHFKHAGEGMKGSSCAGMGTFGC